MSNGFALSGILDETAEMVLERVEAKAKEAWDEIPAAELKAVRAAARDRAELTILRMGGQDVSTELAIVDATIANWAWVEAHRLRSALLETIEEVAVIVGRVVLKIGAALLESQTLDER